MQGTIKTRRIKGDMKKVLVGLAVLLLLGVGVAVGWYLVGQRQMLGKKAAVVGGTAQIRLSPEAQSTQVGSSFPVNILFSTGSTAISAVTIQLDYDYTGAEPSLGVSNIAFDPELLATGEWSVPIKTFTAANGHARVRLAAINTSLNGFTSVSEILLVTLTFSANSAGTINVTFDPTESKTTTKADGSDVLLIPASTGTYTATAVPTPTLVPTPTGTLPTPIVPTATIAPGETPFPQPQNSGGGQVSSQGGGGELPVTGVAEWTILGIVGGMILLVGGAGLLVVKGGT